MLHATLNHLWPCPPFPSPSFSFSHSLSPFLSFPLRGPVKASLQKAQLNFMTGHICASHFRLLQRVFINLPFPSSLAPLKNAFSVLLRRDGYRGEFKRRRLIKSAVKCTSLHLISPDAWGCGVGVRWGLVITVSETTFTPFPIWSIILNHKLTQELSLGT